MTVVSGDVVEIDGSRGTITKCLREDDAEIV
jgi:hypothetical protein